MGFFIIMLKLDHAIFSFDDKNSFHFNCQFKQTAVTLITGASGAGKSTLLHLIAGFYKLESGAILHNDKEIHHLLPAQKKISFLFQAHNLFPHLNLRQNIALAFANKSVNLSNQQQNQLVDDLIHRFKLQDYHAEFPENISGGQQQRVALARIFAQIQTQQCQILLLDEPFNGLDAGLRAELMAEIHHITKKFQLICLFISHHPEEITKFADDKWHVCDGRIDLMA